MRQLLPLFVAIILNRRREVGFEEREGGWEVGREGGWEGEGREGVSEVGRRVSGRYT